MSEYVTLEKVTYSDYINFKVGKEMSENPFFRVGTRERVREYLDTPYAYLSKGTGNG